MAEWLLEEGIAEERAIQLNGATITAARVRWPGKLGAGQVQYAKLISKAAGSRRGTALFANGEEALVDRLPAYAGEGAQLRLEVTRAAIGERGRLKRATARPSDLPIRSAPTLEEALAADGHEVRWVRAFPTCDWDEMVSEAFARKVDFAGGSLLFSLTPAMLLTDIDGTLPPRELALAAVPSLAAVLRRFDIAGSVGIDFPTLPAKADRRAIDEALAGALVDWPHERTAMNGFGFVQLVAKLERPSLLHLAASQCAGLGARVLLRMAEHLEGAGAVLLTSHPAVDAELRPDWLDELARRTGREVRRAADPALALEAPHAQLVPR